MTEIESSPRERWRIWAALLLLSLFTALPGPSRSPFSGIPFSMKAHVTVSLLLLAGVVFALFPTRRRITWKWLIVLIVLCGAKAAISTALVDEGWRGQYWTAQIHSMPQRHAGPLAPVRFYRRGVRDFRVDRDLRFNDINFALLYVNDWPVEDFEINITPRHVTQPLHVHWIGYVEAGSAATFSTVVNANGSVAIRLDGRDILHAANPQDTPVSFVLSPAASQSTHRIDIDYDKVAGEKPLFSMEPLGLFVTPSPVSAADLSRSRLAGHGIDLLGVVALLVLAGVFVSAYRPITHFFLEEIWASPDRVALVAFVGVVLLAGMAGALETHGATQPLPNGDDPVAYEAGARAVLFNGILMKRTPADASPFFFYPLYSYALAGMHMLFGEDFGTIRFFNWLCVAAAAVLLWALLRKRLTPGSLVVVLLGFAFFTHEYLLRYLQTAFTDNLFLPLAVATVLVSAIAFERKSYGWLFLTGIVTALGAATRPSLIIHAPFVVLALLIFWTGSIVRRAVAAGTFGTGFALMIAPFTIRNWIVAHKLVPLMSSYVILPVFLFGPGQNPDQSLGDGTISGSIRAFLSILAHAPGRSLWLEIRKVLFTLGFTQVFDGFNINSSILLILVPVAFLMAARARRIPRPMLIAIGTFAVSHLVAMVVAAPWTYGYKTILPFHLMLAAGAAFLLPRRGEAVAREVVIPHKLPEGRKTVSVVLPTYNEKDSIREVILDFFATGVVDEVIVVNNNAAPGTSEEVSGTGAREVLERRQGYGCAIRRGLQEAVGDYIVICEPDGTFLARDILKLLAYADDFDVVYGSRTSQPLVWHGANMGFFLRFGNWAVAKYMQLIFNTPSLSDVGCTMRLLKRYVVEELAGEFTIDGSQFGVEMMALTLRHGFRVAQIPVNYAKRVGVSSVTGDPSKAFGLGLQMIWLITQHRIREALASRGDHNLGAEQTPTMNS
jgi:hypothetical protein